MTSALKDMLLYIDFDKYVFKNKIIIIKKDWLTI